MEADISVRGPAAAQQTTHTPEQLEAFLEEAGGNWRVGDYYEGSGEHLKEDSDDFSYLFSHLESIQQGDIEGEYNEDIYEGEDAKTRMTHLMHSDTMVVVVGLFVMICIGLTFRYLCMRLTSQNSRKERVRGGLRALADHMHTVTRSMSNELEEEDSARSVMRTYSNYGKGRPAGPAGPDTKEGTGGEGVKPAPVRQQSRENLRVQAFSNTLAKEGLCVPGQVSIEMSESLSAPAQKR